MSAGASMEMESASRCDRCGEIVADIDAGFSPATQLMAHDCGGAWQPVRWHRTSGAVAPHTEEERP